MCAIELAKWRRPDGQFLLGRLTGARDFCCTDERHCNGAHICGAHVPARPAHSCPSRDADSAKSFANGYMDVASDCVEVRAEPIMREAGHEDVGV